MSSEHLVDTDWLEARLCDDGLRIVDLRGHLLWEQRTDGAPWKGAREEYDQSHIPGAHFLDFATDLINLGDRTPLQVAGFPKLQQIFEAHGIGDEHMVIAYDADRSIFAAPLWWIFRLCGHANIRVLDGGWPKWTSEDRPVSSELPAHAQARFTIAGEVVRRATVEDVLEALERRTPLLLDARARQDFLGNPKWAERGGHIPGALNIPGGDLLRPDGTFRSLEELKRIIESSVDSVETPLITYCGLGLSATALAFVLDMLGFRRVSVFDGSWAEWGAREDLPCARSGVS